MEDCKTTIKWFICIESDIFTTIQFSMTLSNCLSIEIQLVNFDKYKTKDIGTNGIEQ